MSQLKILWLNITNFHGFHVQLKLTQSAALQLRTPGTVDLSAGCAFFTGEDSSLLPRAGTHLRGSPWSKGHLVSVDAAVFLFSIC